MDAIYNLYCRILEQREKKRELVPDDDGILLKMHEEIVLIQYETLLKLMDREMTNLRENYTEMLHENLKP